MEQTRKNIEKQVNLREEIKSLEENQQKLLARHRSSSRRRVALGSGSGGEPPMVAGGTTAVRFEIAALFDAAVDPAVADHDLAGEGPG